MVEADRSGEAKEGAARGQRMVVSRREGGRDWGRKGQRVDGLQWDTEEAAGMREGVQPWRRRGLAWNGDCKSLSKVREEEVEAEEELELDSNDEEGGGKSIRGHPRM